eukprot:UN22828
MQQENIFLKGELDNVYKEIIDYELVQVDVQQASMNQQILRSHIPTSIKMDEIVIKFLKLVERSSGRCRGIRNLLNRLYLKSDSPTLVPEDIQIARRVGQACLTIECCLQAVLSGLIPLTDEKFSKVLISWRSLLPLDGTLEFIFLQIQETSLQRINDDEIKTRLS